MTTRDAVGIREVSDQTGLSVDTLRWYERQGLLPGIGRRSDGRRRYSSYAVGFVRLVQVLRRTGMPVSEVREFSRLGGGDLAHHGPRLAMLERHAAGIEEKMAQLRADHAAVQREADHYRAMIAHGQSCEERLRSSSGG